MRFWFQSAICVLAGSLCAVLAGCAPGQERTSEEKEPHFVLGQSRVNAMDYQGAIEAFDESLEVNPHSAAAHFELGWLFEEKVPDPAAAIYHYQRYLKLNPNAENAALIRLHVDTCKQQLAADVLGLPSTSAAQQQLEKLAEQNRELQDELNKWRAQTNAPLPAPAPVVQSVPSRTAVANPTRAAVAAGTVRTHTVASGETAIGIARKFGVKLSALEAANPGMNPSRIQIGQVLNVPLP
jgi:tetratricopeptide (TPR) repeat protein